MAPVSPHHHAIHWLEKFLRLRALYLKRNSADAAGIIPSDIEKMKAVPDGRMKYAVQGEIDSQEAHNPKVNGRGCIGIGKLADEAHDLFVRTFPDLIRLFLPIVR